MSVAAELQKLVLTRLKADAALTALVQQRIFDEVPASSKEAYPRLTMGPYDFVAADADCIFAGEHTLQIDIWSRAVGNIEAKRIVDAVRLAIRNIGEVEIDVYGVVEIKADFARVIDDPDGKTAHGIVQVEALIEEPE